MQHVSPKILTRSQKVVYRFDVPQGSTDRQLAAPQIYVQPALCQRLPYISLQIGNTLCCEQTNRVPLVLGK